MFSKWKFAQIQNSWHAVIPTVRTALDQFYGNVIVIRVDYATNSVTLICKFFYASVITKELGLSNNDNTSTYKQINDLFYDHLVKKNISDLISKFGIENVFIKNDWLPNMYCLPKMH